MIGIRFVSIPFALILLSACSLIRAPEEYDYRSEPLIRVGEPAPDVILHDPFTLEAWSLSEVQREGRPLVLVFGSFT